MKFLKKIFSLLKVNSKQEILTEKVKCLESRLAEIEKILEDQTITIAHIATLQVDVIRELKYVLEIVSPSTDKQSLAQGIFYPIDISGDDDLIN
tara:strand:+ start:61 stop:342 length:282 start_codon:yes stop_codon:yes gene_type:complete